MSLRTAVAAPFRSRGRDRLAESEFVVALSLDRDWFTPDQAKRLVDVAAGEGLLERADGDIRATFDPESVDVPDGYEPEESILQQRSTFERALDAVVADGVEKREAVAGINQLQSELGLAVEAAAVVYARRRGVDTAELAERAMEELRD